MKRLVTLDLNEVENLIKPVLEKYPVIVGAYIYGSALDQCRTDSDIDVGIVLSGRVDMSEQEQDLLIEKILTEVPRYGKHLIDLTILRKSDAFFTHQAIKTGKLFYVKDAEELTDFIEIISHKYRENYPRYRQALESIAKEA